MDLRKSAGSDIERLQEMVKRLEEQNAQLKGPFKGNEYNRVSAKNLNTGMVKVRLGLDDVPLLDVNGSVSEDYEDSWLYESPVHLPTPVQKSVSPYKYLKDSIDISDLNKVRGSLMAKLESIAAQEEVLFRSPSIGTHGHHSRHSIANSDSYQESTASLELANGESRDCDGDDDDIGSDDTAQHEEPLRQGQTNTTFARVDEDLVVRGPLRRRGGNPQYRPSAAGDNERTHRGDITPDPKARRGPTNCKQRHEDFDSEPNGAALVDGDIPIVTAVRRRPGNRDTGVRPRLPPSSPKPLLQQSGSSPVRRRELVRPDTAEDINIRRRSLPQAPTQNRTGANQVVPTRRSNTPPNMTQTVPSPSLRRPLGRPESPVSPRGSQLAAPRRIPTPRGVSPARSYMDESWMDDCY